MQNLSVLIVEDCVIQRLYATRLLHQLAITDISYAANGEQALERLAAKVADVVLVDLEMGVMNGIELLRHIARQKLCSKVIIASAKDPLLLTSVTTMAEADGLTILGTLSKPISIDLLTLCLKKAQHQQVTKQDSHPVFNISSEMLRRAMESDQFTLVYQPIVPANQSTPVAAEVLARWTHPELGPVSPDQFIEAAERFHLIEPLSLMLLQQALSQLKLWNRQGVFVNLSFNLSALSLPDTLFMNRIMQIAQEQEISADQLMFEVTESADFTDLASSIENLASLRLRGFSIAIDDYGTGYANTQQLLRVPANRLKLDRSMVSNVTEGSQQFVILANTIQMAKQLGLSVVAEGIETQAEADALTALGVEYQQGYYHSRPLDAEALIQYLQQ
ncbi:EAL domain-containing protein [Rheinheimera sp. A13L]|uniref:EAL domain-containing response regulator n=1 Tax=Rheinheimera sp. A13L TaxID=506534 RepID=UPI0002125140|nr:EAL domain-containing response regulator [Rheinheimera sp. A13L]EGM76994.1 EAL domain-containing protein [Rheinheimera sp. A13L]